jgi:hypothetical protein
VRQEASGFNTNTIARGRGIVRTAGLPSFYDMPYVLVAMSYEDWIFALHLLTASTLVG